MANNEAVFFYYDQTSQKLKGRVLTENTEANSIIGNEYLTPNENGMVYESGGFSSGVILGLAQVIVVTAVLLSPTPLAQKTKHNRKGSLV